MSGMTVEEALAGYWSDVQNLAEGDGDAGRVLERIECLAAEVRRYRAAEQALDDSFDRLNADAVNIANPHDKEAVAYFNQRANGAAVARAAFKSALLEEVDG